MDLLERMRRNPRADWTIKDVETVCGQHGVQCIPGKGSHYNVRHPTSRELLTIPAARPIKPVYIRLLVKLISDVPREV
ncbi:MAG: type II toxin-antitoxin system HicA family toxin [Pseudomonadota bacterium]|nr:type II toxin-antitoxin system HicA family toxin [Pseudomonadota bacterium]